MKIIARGGHKTDCQCAICKAIRQKAERVVASTHDLSVILTTSPSEVRTPEVEPVITVGSLQIGEVFQYQITTAGPTRVYKKVFNSSVVNAQELGVIGDEIIQLLSSTPVRKMPPPIPGQEE